MPWVKVDDGFGVHPKVQRIPRAARLAAVGLWQLALTHTARALTDGTLDADELDNLDAPPQLVHELVRVGLWHEHGHDCDRCAQPPTGGVTFHDYAEYQPSGADVRARRESERAAKSAAGIETAHKRWHAGPGRSPSPACALCTQTDSSAIAELLAPESLPRSLPNSPDPDPETDTATVPESLTNPAARASDDIDDNDPIDHDAHALGIRNLDTIRSALAAAVGEPLDDASAVDLSRAILASSATHVGNPDAYIAAACHKRDGEGARRAWAALSLRARPVGELTDHHQGEDPMNQNTGRRQPLAAPGVVS